MSLMISRVNNTKENIIWRLGYLLIVLITGYLVFFVFNTQIDAFVLDLENKILGIDNANNSKSIDSLLPFESLFNLVDIYFISFAVKLVFVQIAISIWWKIGAFIGVVEKVNDIFSAKVEAGTKEDKSDQFTANDLFWVITLTPLGASLVAWLFLLILMFID
ncbi:hypothetical protein ABTI98_15205 [Acinetobacter baumannii]